MAKICFVVERGLTKKGAAEEAKKLRGEGYSVRVLRGKKSYSVIDCGGDEHDGGGISTIVLGASALAAAGAGYLVGKGK